MGKPKEENSMKKTAIDAYVQENPSMGWCGNRFRASAVDRGRWLRRPSFLASVW